MCHPLRAALACACAAALVLSPAAALAVEGENAPGGVHAADATLSHVYLDMYGGSDADDGVTAATAVASFDKAKELLATDGEIVLVSPILVDSGQVTLSLEGKGNARVVRGAGQEGSMIRVEGGASLTLDHIVFDGTMPDKNLDPIITVDGKGCRVTLNAGTILENNRSAGGQSGSAIELWGKNELVMNDGAVIRGNETTSAGYGTVFLANGGHFTMNGGVIGNNRANRGGGVALLASSMEMNGGRIIENAAYDVQGQAQNKPVGDGYGGGVYLSSYENMSGVPGEPNAVVAGDASFVMNGGEIVRNDAESQGGGILGYPMSGTGDITVEIHGGSIDGNNAIQGNGGGVALYDLYADPAVTFEMTGGSVSGNRTPAQGGGVFLFNMAGESARMTGGRIEKNSAGLGGGVSLYGGSVWNMTNGSIADNKAGAGGGVFLYPPVEQVAESTLKMSGGTIAGNEAKKELAGGKVAGKGAGVFQAGTFELSDDAVVSVENDVYLPSGRIIDVVDAFDGATRACPVSITSEDHAVEPVDAARPGTKLVRYHDAAGGVDAARGAHRNQLFVPSEKMLEIDPTFYIGKSSHADQLDFMTYIAKPAEYTVTYRFAGEVPAGADKLLPAAEKRVAGEYVGIAADPMLEGYRFLGWKVVTADVEVADGALLMPEGDVVIEGMWEKTPAPEPEPEPEPEPQPEPEPEPEPEPQPDPDQGDGSDQGADQKPPAGSQDDAQGGSGDKLPQTGDAAMMFAAAPLVTGCVALAAGRHARRSHE